MLLKAENRTVSALLHAKDGKQVRQVLIAAMRRAGLDQAAAAAAATSHSDTEQQQEQQAQVVLDLTAAIHSNVEQVAAMQHQLQYLAVKTEVMHGLDTITQAIMDQSNMLQAMQDKIEDLTVRMSILEEANVLLPKKQQRMCVPTTPTSGTTTPRATRGESTSSEIPAPATPTVVGNESLAPTPAPDRTAAVAAAASTDDPSRVLQALEHQSLRNQCSKALAPFRVSK